MSKIPSLSTLTHILYCPDSSSFRSFGSFRASYVFLLVVTKTFQILPSPHQGAWNSVPSTQAMASLLFQKLSDASIHPGATVLSGTF
jgi:hypothetical protein